jgi:cell wall-associated NlpC family hydrolase
MLAYAPGVATLTADLAALRPGDLVFFDASDDGGAGVIDHVGIYLGVDTLGHHRMLNSRNSMRGPTMRDGASTDGETSARSILDGTGLYARSFRASRRL